MVSRESRAVNSEKGIWADRTASISCGVPARNRREPFLLVIPETGLVIPGPLPADVVHQDEADASPDNVVSGAPMMRR
jgi:hypothetical protein